MGAAQHVIAGMASVITKLLTEHHVDKALLEGIYLRHHRVLVIQVSTKKLGTVLVLPVLLSAANA